MSPHSYFNGNGTMPPSFGDSEVLFAVSLFGMLAALVMSLEWMWRICWKLHEDRHDLKHPVTVSRLMTLFLLVGIAIRIHPDVLWMMAWNDLGPDERQLLAQYDRLSDGIAVIPMIMAWMTSVVGAAMVDWQLVRLPIPVDLWPTRAQFRRAFIAVGLMLVISLSIAFLGG